MGYRLLRTISLNLFPERMGSTRYGLAPEDYAGNPVDLTGSTFHLWVGAPDPFKPITVKMVQVNPASGYTVTSTLVSFNVTEADLASWGLPPGTWPWEMLCTNDGGVTTDKIYKGNIIVGSWLTDTF